MKLKFLILFLISSLNVLAQVKPIYFEGERVINEAEYATSYGIVGKLTAEEIYILKRYDLDDKLLMTGNYKDAQLTIPHGKFVFYQDVEQFNTTNHTYFNLGNKDRFVSQSGEYADGLEQGVWIFYFPDGKPGQVTNYKNGKLDGDFTVFTQKGKKEVIGHYRDGLKTGTWYMLKNKKLSIYENDKLVSSRKLTKDEILTIE